MKPKGLSFVLCTTGQRTSFLDEAVIPAIVGEARGPFEIVLAGRYRGRYSAKPWMRLVQAPVGGDMFYKPFQAGVACARFPWIVDLDDDMLLEAGWHEAVEELSPSARGEIPIVGFTMLNPDGSIYGGYFDAIHNRLSGSMRGTATYFSSYMTRAELFKRVPYPTYASGDRVHVLRIGRSGLSVRKQLSRAACVIHAGTSRAHPGMTKKTNEHQVRHFGELFKALGKGGVAWEAFADHYLDGQPGVSFLDAKAAAAHSVNEPALKRTTDWLQASPPVVPPAPPVDVDNTAPTRSR